MEVKFHFDNPPHNRFKWKNLSKNRISCEKKNLQTIESLKNKTDKNFRASCGEVKMFKIVYWWDTSMKMHVCSQNTTINWKMLRKRLQNGADTEVGSRQKIACIMRSRKRSSPLYVDGNRTKNACSQNTTINQKEQASKLFKEAVHMANKKRKKWTYKSQKNEAEMKTGDHIMVVESKCDLSSPSCWFVSG